VKKNREVGAEPVKKEGRGEWVALGRKKARKVLRRRPDPVNRGERKATNRKAVPRKND